MNALVPLFFIAVTLLVCVLTLALLAMIRCRHKTLHDMTEIKRLEAAIIEESDRLAVTLRSIGDGVIAVDTEEKVVLLNDVAEQLTGWSADEAIGKPFQEIFNAIHETTGEAIDSPVTRVLRTAQSVFLAANPILVARNGQRTAVADSCSPIRDGNGTMTGAVLVFRDVTEQKQAQKAVAESERRLRTLVEGASDGIFTTDSTGRYTDVNTSACAMVGYTREEILDKSISDLIPGEEMTILSAEMGKLAAGETTLTEHRLLHKDGRMIPVEISARALPDGRLQGFVRDITARKNLEAQLVHSQKLESIGQLAAGIAHEINTPIQYIGDNTRFVKDAFGSIMELLEAYGKLAETAGSGQTPAELVEEVEALGRKANLAFLAREVPQALEQTIEGISRVTTIVRAMKEFSHPGTKDKTPTDINKAIETTATVARNEWKYAAEMQMDFDENLPHVPCLPGDFNQVMLNLIVNAAHAIAEKNGPQSQEKGKISISTRLDGDWVEIRVADTGPGIPEAIRSRVFDPFFTTKPVGTGTGQGLAISHSVIKDQHNGSITLETQEGQGATFIVRLPVYEADTIGRAA